MKAYVLIETAAGKTKQVKKALAKVKSARASVSAMDAVTGPYRSEERRVGKECRL